MRIIHKLGDPLQKLKRESTRKMERKLQLNASKSKYPKNLLFFRENLGEEDELALQNEVEILSQVDNFCKY